MTRLFTVPDSYHPAWLEGLPTTSQRRECFAREVLADDNISTGDLLNACENYMARWGEGELARTLRLGRFLCGGLPEPAHKLLRKLTVEGVS